MPWYRKYGKLQTVLGQEDFNEILETGRFARSDHKGFLSLIYYTGVRKAEALRSIKEQFTLQNLEIIYDVLKRLKHGKQTPPLNIPLSYPGAEEIWECVEETKPGSRVWPYSPKTAYNIVARATRSYPHHLRLSRFTSFFLEGFNIAQVRAWSGLTLNSLDHYVGMVQIQKMGRHYDKTKKRG